MKYKINVSLHSHETGEVFGNLTKEYGFYYKSDSVFLHKLLDRFIERVKSGETGLQLQFSQFTIKEEQTIPF